MSNSKLLIALAIVLIALGAWWYLSPKNITTPGNEASSVKSSEKTQSNSSATAITASNSTDASLEADINNVDAELNKLDADNSAVDKGLNDTQIPQTE